MSAKQLKFVFGACLLAMLAFLLGEAILYLVLENTSMAVTRGWAIAVVAITLILNIWKCPKN